jgi:cysteine synthase
MTMFVGEGISGCIGATPMLRLLTLRPAGCAEIFAKLESFNVTGSVKARAARHMLTAAERTGKLDGSRPVVEPSSGNLGLALAQLCASRGYECHLVVDPRMTAYSEGVMNAYGPHVHEVVEPDERGSWQGSRLARARELVAAHDGYMCFQYGNPSNPQAHYETTGPEIVDQLGDTPCVCVIGVSTGGQASGIGRYLKEKDPDVRIVAVDVNGSCIFGGSYRAYRLRGLGLSWWPENLDGSVIDDAYVVDEELAFLSARLLARHAGICSGGAAGAIVAVGLREAARVEASGSVVVVIPERGDRYLRQFHDDDWLEANGYRGDFEVDTWIDTCLKLEPVERSWKTSSADA